MNAIDKWTRLMEVVVLLSLAVVVYSTIENGYPLAAAVAVTGILVWGRSLVRGLWNAGPDDDRNDPAREVDDGDQ